MAFDYLNRAQRRAAQAYARAQVVNRPATLTPIPQAEWPPTHRYAHQPPAHVWCSKHYLVQMFDEQPFQGIETRRLSVNRVTLKADGHWEENLTWDELQSIKHEIGFGEWYGLEIYPPDRHVVNVANLRHLWLLARPLALGWFNDSPRAGGTSLG